MNICNTKVSYNIYDLLFSSFEKKIILFKKGKKYRQNLDPRSILNYELYKLELRYEEINKEFPIWGIKYTKAKKEYYKKKLVLKNNFKCFVCQKKEKPSKLFVHIERNRHKKEDVEEKFLTCNTCCPLLSNTRLKDNSSENLKLIKLISFNNRLNSKNLKIKSLQSLFRDEKKDLLIRIINKNYNKHLFKEELKK